MPSRKPKLSTEHRYGFDYMRAFFSVMVVLWHTYPLAVFPISTQVQNILYFNIALLAVPTFFLLSLYLFYIKLETDKNYFFSKRFPRLLALYCFWMGVFVLFTHLVAMDLSVGGNNIIINYLVALFDFRKNDLYWFLFDLIIVTSVAFLNWSLYHRSRKLYWQYELLAVSIIPFFLIPYFARVLPGVPHIGVSNAFNFIPFVFLAMILVELVRSKNFAKLMPQVLLGGFVIYMIFVLLEWLVLFDPLQGYWNILPGYTRISSIIAAGSILLVATRVKRKPGRVIHLLSSYSLGIFLIHWYIALLFQATPLYKDPGAGHAIIFIITLTLSIILTGVIKKIPVIGRFV